MCKERGMRVKIRGYGSPFIRVGRFGLLVGALPYPEMTGSALL